MGRCFVTFLAWAFLLIGLAPADAERRVALVIGNGAYLNATKLTNPTNDAADVARELRRIGFDVIEGRDLDKRAMEATILEFGEKLDRADLALFFYAGHGMQVGNKNYLIPTDARLERAGNLNFETIDIALVLAQMEADRRVNLVFLDACRDNPLARSFARSLGANRSAAVGRGLARIESAVGTMIAYATQPDNVALDGDGMRNSPFTTALLRHMATPGLEIRSMMTRVRADVLVATREKQLPWDHSSLIGEVMLVPGVAEQPGASHPTSDEITWSFLKDTQDASQLQRFIEQFPDSLRRGDAAARLRILEQARIAAVQPKQSVPLTQNTEAEAAGPGRSSTFDPGVIYDSGADAGSDKTIKSAEACRDLCLATPACRLWQFGSDPAICQMSKTVGYIYNNRATNYVSGRIIMPTEAAAAPPASNSIQVDFDALYAYGAASGVGDKQLVDYLAKFSIKLVTSATQRVAAFDDRNVYEGNAVRASSGRGVLMQQGGNPVSYMLEFAAPLKSISFDRVALVAGPNGITHPNWTVTAFDAAGNMVATVGEDEIRSFADVPSRTFTLSATGIRRLRVEGDHRGFAAFSSLVLDDLVLVME